MANGAAPPAREYTEYSRATRLVIMIALMLGAIMQVIDTSIVNVAIPQMMGNLGATLDQIGWVSTGYLIAMVIVLPLTGWLSALFGRKRYLAYSMISFTIASVLCGISRTLGQLVLFRIFQGIGGAALISTAQATMMEIFPPQQLGMVQAIYGIGIMVGPTIGPTLGGWLTDNYSWPWIFFINLPIGTLAAILTFLFVHDSEHKRANVGVDLTGIMLLAIGLGSLQVVLEKGNREDWFASPFIVWMSVAAVMGIVGFVLWELRTPHPAVNLRVLRDRGFSAGAIFAVVLGFGLFGGIFILPVFLQQLQHFTALQTGMMMLPGAISTAIVMPFAGKLVSHFPARNLVALGAIAFVVSSFLLSKLTMDTGYSQMFWPLVLRGAAMGFLFVPLTLATLIGLKGKDLADGTGLFNLARTVGGSAGIAVLSTLLDRRMAFHRAILVEHVNLYNPATIIRLRTLEAGFLAKGSSLPVARQQALAIVDRIVQGQAAVLSYADVFYLIAIFFVCALPLLLLFKKGRSIPSGRPGPVAE